MKGENESWANGVMECCQAERMTEEKWEASCQHRAKWGPQKYVTSYSRGPKEII